MTRSRSIRLDETPSETRWCTANSRKQSFSRWFNKVHERHGTLWEERFKSVLAEDGHAAHLSLGCRSCLSNLVQLECKRARLFGL